MASERDEFEAWARTMPGCTDRSLRRRDMAGSERLGQYVEQAAEAAWAAWQARAAQAAAVPAENWQARAIAAETKLAMLKPLNAHWQARALTAEEKLAAQAQGGA